MTYPENHFKWFSMLSGAVFPKLKLGENEKGPKFNIMIMERHGVPPRH
jgi:hypothetical protein